MQGTSGKIHFLITITNKPNNGKEDEYGRQWWYGGMVVVLTLTVAVMTN